MSTATLFTDFIKELEELAESTPDGYHGVRVSELPYAMSAPFNKWSEEEILNLIAAIPEKFKMIDLSAHYRYDGDNVPDVGIVLKKNYTCDKDYINMLNQMFCDNSCY